MSKTTWFRILTRPTGHLVGTIAVSVLLILCAAIALAHPEWQPPLVLIGSIPLIIWSTVMAVIFHRERTEPPDQT